jgi:arylsulfatase
MATAVDVSGATYPRGFQGQPITPLQGVSLVPALNGDSDPLHAAPIFWEHQGNAAVRDGRWKLVKRNDSDDGWELYDMTADRMETKNLAAEQPDHVARMEQQFLAWAARSQVQWPWPLKPYELK